MIDPTTRRGAGCETRGSWESIIPAIIGAAGARLSRACQVVEPTLGRGDHALGHALPAEPRPGPLRQRRGGTRAAGRVKGEPGRELPGDLVDGVRPQIEGEERPEVL